MLSIKNLQFSFCKTDRVPFFNDIALVFKKHTLTFIQGDNGSGKSTFFSLLNGTMSQQAQFKATIFFDQHEYIVTDNRVPEQLIKQVHVVQQKYDQMLASHCTFEENMQLANLPYYPGLQKLPGATFFEVMHTFGIKKETPVSFLSGGQRQLLAILMALQKQTKILLLDEPTATLDKKNAYMVMNCLKQLAQQLDIIIIIICHDKDLIKAFSDETFVVEADEQGTREIRKVMI